MGPLPIRLMWVSKLSQISLAHAAIVETNRFQSSLAHSASEVSSQITAKPFKAMPSPYEWPIFGHLPLMMKKESQERMHMLFDRLRDELGDIYRIKVPGQADMVLVYNPEDVKHFYNNDDKIPIIPGFEISSFIRTKIMKDRYLTAGLIVNNEDWYTVRSQVQQDMMRPKSAIYYIADMEDIAMDLVEKIRRERGKNGVLDVHRTVQEYALEAVGCVFMGVRLGTLSNSKGDGHKLIKLNDEIMPLLVKMFLLPERILPYFPDFKRMISLMEESFDICKKHVDAAIDRVTEQDESLLAKLVRKCGRESGIPLIMGIDALQAGIDTTGTTASFLLYHLATNPDKQEKLYEEICEVIGPNGAMSEQALARMKFMKACQTESQRILPAVFGSSRKTIVDSVLGGFQIPAGTTVIRNGHGMSNDPEHFPQPHKFLPERWLRGCPERTIANPFANIPFGHGARSCIGRRFAQLELYIMMVKVVQKFRLEYDGPEIGVLTKFVSLPDKEVNIKFIERS